MNGLLRIEALRLSRGPREVLRGVGLEVARSECCTLMGLSGSGKTTALRVIAAIEPFEAGRIEVDGFALLPGPVPPESRLKGLRRRVGLVFQAHALFEHLTAMENVVLAPVHVLRQDRSEAERRALELFESLGVASRARAYPRELSGGEAERVAIARALVLDPALLLMDEPTASLDPARRASLGESLRALADGGRGLLVATHDTDFARAFADRVVILSEGRVVEEGPAAAILRNPTHPATKELLRYRSPDPRFRADGRIVATPFHGKAR
jgi:ABC-type polar amino acid transport system ATPase subunit